MDKKTKCQFCGATLTPFAIESHYMDILINKVVFRAQIREIEFKCKKCGRINTFRVIKKKLDKNK